MHISGKSVVVNKNINDVFNFLADFNNFERLMPEQVSEWQSDSESCSFSVKGMGKVGMKYAKKAKDYKEQIQFDIRKINLSNVVEKLKRTQDEIIKLPKAEELKRGIKVQNIIDIINL